MATVYVYIFYALANGGTVVEPDVNTAVIEFLLAIATSLYFIARLLYHCYKVIKHE